MAEVHRLDLRPPAAEVRSRLLIGDGVLDAAAADIEPWLSGRTVFVLSSPEVRRHQGHRLAPLTAPAARVVDLEVVDGEAAKGLGHAGDLWRRMLAAGGKRDSRLLAFGGGSVGDLGGFVAGCFLRGIELAQVPTTLLAQVDASVGGKTGVDLPGGKNTVGLFHHPAWVLADTRVLASLDAGELRSGLVEVVKMAALLDVALFERVERDLDSLLSGDAGALAPVVAAAVAAKASVVRQDPREAGLRRILNFGHTLGHAIEGVLEYRHLRHGEAVAYGLLFVLRLAESLGLATDDLGERLRRLLRRLDLPDLPLDRGHAGALMAFVGRDKKATEDGVAWVLPRGFGDLEPLRTVAPGRVRAEIGPFLDDPFAPPAA